MSYSPAKPAFIEAQDILELCLCSALTVLLFSQLFVRKGSVRLHYYLLLLANFFGIIRYALNVSITLYTPSVFGIYGASMIFSSFASTLTHLAAVFALRQFTATYLGGAMASITIMCSLSVAWCVVTVVLSGIEVGSFLSQADNGMEYTIQLILNWGYFALCVWSIFIVFAIRILYHRRTPKDETKDMIVPAFALLGLFVAMLAVSTIYDTVIGTLALDIYYDTRALIAGIFVDALFFRCATLLFVFFYQRLSVMAPLFVMTAEDEA